MQSAVLECDCDPLDWWETPQPRQEEPQSLGTPDGELLLRFLVREFAHDGWDTEHMIAVFRDPYYVAPHGLYAEFGEEELRRRIEAVCAA